MLNLIDTVPEMNRYIYLCAGMKLYKVVMVRLYKYSLDCLM